MGVLLSSVTTYLLGSEDGVSNVEITNEAVGFLEVFALSFRTFYPSLHLEHYEKFLALLYHLLVNHFGLFIDLSHDE